MKLAHAVNPFRASPSSELSWVQPITYESMRVARAFAQPQVEVELLSVQYAEDRVMVPEGFRATPDLRRSVLDLREFQQRRKLPLLADILDTLHDATDADWLIYTNNDIGLMPHFYATVKRLIETGRDALVINRRILSDELRGVEDIPLMYAMVGDPHEGHDCFVFPRATYKRYRLANVSIGAPWVGRAMLWNMLVHARRFEELRNEHLTFHLGITDWESDIASDYARHNEGELLKVFQHLRESGARLEKGSPMARYLGDVWYLIPMPEYRPRGWKKPGKWVLKRARAVWRALRGR
jgi:hypothetical protein